MLQKLPGQYARGHMTVQLLLSRASYAVQHYVKQTFYY